METAVYLWSPCSSRRVSFVPACPEATGILNHCCNPVVQIQQPCWTTGFTAATSDTRKVTAGRRLRLLPCSDVSSQGQFRSWICSLLTEMSSVVSVCTNAYFMCACAWSTLLLLHKAVYFVLFLLCDKNEQNHFFPTPKPLLNVTDQDVVVESTRS